jgi:hypothetical protein
MSDKTEIITIDIDSGNTKGFFDSLKNFENKLQLKMDQTNENKEIKINIKKNGNILKSIEFENDNILIIDNGQTNSNTSAQNEYTSSEQNISNNNLMKNEQVSTSEKTEQTEQNSDMFIDLEQGNIGNEKGGYRKKTRKKRRNKKRISNRKY